MNPLQNLLSHFKLYILHKRNQCTRLIKNNKYTFYIEFMEFFAIIPKRKTKAANCYFIAYLVALLYVGSGLVYDTYQLISKLKCEIVVGCI